ncbi:MAG: chromosome partitioning protein ParB [Puniceicoccaceae bacterium MED-G30]|nr:MAG: chromosome partitioning protein ParB [Puniceicoccaceae bacterium MED-G30]RPG84826.1 MAG: ParB/RepB/Spo0J family partition protein [Coraliomargarita sp. TMED73]|tara:strand:+ start:1921 stop:2886 length:966 start_codon:yes stop_codon:yes gene_type:complete
MSPKSRLGRGLGGLIDGAAAPTPPAAPEETPSKASPATPAPQKTAPPAKAKAAAESDGLRELSVKDIVPNPHQPRREIDPRLIKELARSIRSEGLLQPIVVRAKGKRFELIAGERRLRAFKQLERKKIPARIIEAGDASSASLALIENLQRENLNPVDEALGYASLIRDFGLTQEAAAERVGKGRATVANAMRLLSLDSEIQGYLSRRLLSTGHAKVLLALEDDEHRRLLARRIIESGMSVRQAETEVTNLKKQPGSASGKNGRTAPAAEETALRDLEKRISEHLNARASLKHGAKKGKLTIEYLGNDDLDRILEKLGLTS